MLATLAVDAQQLEHVMDGVLRIRVGIFDQRLRGTLFQAHRQHDFGQLQRRFDRSFLATSLTVSGVTGGSGCCARQAGFRGTIGGRIGFFQDKVDGPQKASDAVA
jgi:hypothetical protein